MARGLRHPGMNENRLVECEAFHVEARNGTSFWKQRTEGAQQGQGLCGWVPMPCASPLTPFLILADVVNITDFS